MKRNLCYIFCVGVAFVSSFAVHGTAMAEDVTATSLLKQADQLKEPFLVQVEEMVNVDSPTYYMPGIEKMTEIVTRMMKQLGAEVEVRAATVDQGRNVIGIWRGSGKGKILLMAHTDTVFKEGTVAERPFRVDGNKAFGPGILDDKGGIALGLQAMSLIQKVGFDDFEQVTFLVNSDEERGSFGSRDLIRELSTSHDAAFVLEFGSPDDKVTNWRKGVGYFKLEVSGTSAHAGADPDKGCNALYELAHQVLQLGELGNRQKETTLNFTVIKAGDRYNIIPESAFAQADVRILYPEEFDRLETEYKKLSQDKMLDCATVTPIVERGRPPFPPNPGTDALVAKAQQFYRDIGLELGVEGSGGATDGNYSASVGTTTLDAMGPVGGGAHTPDEYIDLERLGPRIYLLARLMMDVASDK